MGRPPAKEPGAGAQYRALTAGAQAKERLRELLGQGDIGAQARFIGHKGVLRLDVARQLARQHVGADEREARTHTADGRRTVGRAAGNREIAGIEAKLTNPRLITADERTGTGTDAIGGDHHIKIA